MALPCTYAKKVRNPVLFSSLPWHRARPSMHISPPMNLVSRDLWRGGSPPSPPRYCPVSGPRDHVTGHVIARPEFSSTSTVPHPQVGLCMGGGLNGPRSMSRPGRHLYEGRMGTRGPIHLHTQTSYTGTRDNTLRRAYMPATIVVARGLLSPMPLFLAAFYCCGGKG